MKKLIFCIMILGSMILKLNGQKISAQNNSILDSYVKSKITIEKEMIAPDTVGRIFTGTFFSVKTGYAIAEGSESCSSKLLVLKEGKIIEFDNRLDSMRQLLSLVRKDYYMKTEADAKFFEIVLDKIFPPSSLSDNENKQRLKIGNNWYFIRSKFFDSKSGYIVTLDKNFRISNIAYDMEAIKK